MLSSNPKRAKCDFTFSRPVPVTAEAVPAKAHVERRRKMPASTMSSLGFCIVGNDFCIPWPHLNSARFQHMDGIEARSEKRARIGMARIARMGFGGSCGQNVSHTMTWRVESGSIVRSTALA